MSSEFFDPGSGIAVPGIEMRLEYGDASSVQFDRIPGAVLINDRPSLERVRLTQVDGIHADPDLRDSRQERSDFNGERAGVALYSGRTIGLTGRMQAGNIPAMRDTWARFSSQFGRSERDLLIHPPNEVFSYVNELPNTLGIDADGWDSAGVVAESTTITVVTEGHTGVGEVTCLDAPGSGMMRAFSLGGIEDWRGEDIFLSAYVKVQSGALGELGLYLLSMWDGGVATSVALDAQTTPSIGSWYLLSARATGSAVATRADKIGIVLTGTIPGEGDYVMRVARPMIVRLRATDPDPPGYVGGELDGFEWDGVAFKSRSRGRCYAVNMISDPLFADVLTGASAKQLVCWVAFNSSGITVNTPPISTRSWVGLSQAALYYKATKDGTSTSRNIGVAEGNPAGPYGGPHVVAEAREYRLSLKINVLQKPATGTLHAGIRWIGIDDATIATSFGDALTAGVHAVSLQAPAPAGAVAAKVIITCDATTTSAGVLEIYLAEPCFVEVTGWDPGDFVATSTTSDEAITSGIFDQGSRRRIPRPFLIRRVRPTGDMRNTEQQSDGNYRRDFTAALRASDPAIYTLDEARRQVELTGSRNLVVRQAPADFVLEDVIPHTLPLPAGWTYDGEYLTWPSGGSHADYVWSQEAWNYRSNGSFPFQHPLGGVGPKTWDRYGNHGGNDPAQNLKARMYRSGESVTYDQPKVIIGGAPTGFGGDTAPIGAGYGRMFTANAFGTPGIRTFEFNYLGALVKRVSSGTWIELRWNSWSKAAGDAMHPITGEDNSPYAFELWSSHDATGSSGATRVAQWDYESYDSSVYGGVYPFNPSADPMWLSTWILNNVFYWELWRDYPSSIDFSARIESGSYALTPALVTLYGSAVAGSAGVVMCVSNASGTGGGAWNDLADVPPFMHYFESSESSIAPVTVAAPVIGSIETPQTIQLRGDVVDPIVSVTVPEFDGDLGRTSVARFSGTIYENNPITIDLAGDTVRDAAGVDRRDLLVPGSDVALMRPGVNYVSLQATDWSAHSAHLVVSWRDALKSG